MTTVHIVLEHPDMTYYGDAEIHGVFASEDEARAFAESRNLDVSDFGNYGIEAWEIGETSEPR